MHGFSLVSASGLPRAGAFRTTLVEHGVMEVAWEKLSEEVAEGAWPAEP